MRSAKWLAILWALVIIAGCAIPMPAPSGDPGNPVKRIAVLPLLNETNDVDAPEMVRKRLVPALDARLYNVQPLEETDQILRDQMGITIGGQLEMAEEKKLAETLGVEGLLFGVLMDFSETTTGVYNSRNVRGRFRIYDATNDGDFWHNGLGVKSQDSHGGAVGSATVMAAGVTSSDEEVPWVIIDSSSSSDSILSGMALGLGTKLIAKATGTHLQHETDEMIRRVFDNLPIGPGHTTMAAVPEGQEGEAPQVEMPEISAPPVPAIGYMDYGERDFTAIMVSTTVDKTNNRRITFNMPIAKSGQKFRMEIDYAGMTQGESMPPSFSKMISIHRGDQEKAYMLYPNVKKYMVNTEDEALETTEPEVETTEVGHEVIDGHPTIKYKVRVSYEGEDAPQGGHIWKATDLYDMTIKSEFENEGVAFSTLLKDIVLKTPDASLFEVPSDYTESENFMEIVMQEQ